MSKEQQDIYDLYSLVFKDMTNEESKVDENSITAPEQYIVLPSISQKSYNELSPEDRKKLNNLYKELGSNKNNISKYSNFFMGYPTTFEAGGKTFLITPSDTTTEEFVIIDEDGNTIIDNINYITFFKNENEIDYDVNIAKQVGNNSSFITSTDYDQIKITDSNNKTTTLTQNDINKRLTESITNNYLLRQFKYKAGIIK